MNIDKRFGWFQLLTWFIFYNNSLININIIIKKLILNNNIIIYITIYIIY